MNRELLLGLDDNAVTYSDLFKVKLHPHVLPALQDLYSSAATAGFHLAIASGYRSFARQLHIWNQKAEGLRPVLDSDGVPLDMSQLSDDKKMFSILRWSALPGTSRHHWGTDLDVYDLSRINTDYQVQLTIDETEGDGPFADFHRWLTAELEQQSSSFFRPYAADRGGIAPEPWHLSYKLLADVYYEHFSIDLLAEQIMATDIQLKNSVLNNLDEIYERFVKIN